MKNIRDKEAIRSFGISVRQKRLLKELTQDELAFRCGIDTRQIGRIERGEINTTIGSVFALARALELEVASLFDFQLLNLPES